MADSAIQSDVPAPAVAATITEPAEVQKSARELAMEEIELRHQQQMAESNGYELPNDDEPEPNKPATPVDQVAAQLAETPPAAHDLHDKIKIKVDGVETEVPLEDVARSPKTLPSRLRKSAALITVLSNLPTHRLKIAVPSAPPPRK